VAPGVVDARRCLSWLLQVDGELPRAFRVAVGDRIYGCDDCQEVCPPNRRADSEVPPPDAEAGARATVDVLELLDATDDEVLARHGSWYIPRRAPDHVRRNALVVLGNVGSSTDPAVAGTLGRYLRHPNPVLRSHAAWAARRLGRHDLVAGSDDPAVVAELGQPAPPEAGATPVVIAPTGPAER
jgi:epoxyqueuosine reductase